MAEGALSERVGKEVETMGADVNKNPEGEAQALAWDRLWNSWAVASLSTGHSEFQRRMSLASGHSGPRSQRGCEQNRCPRSLAQPRSAPSICLSEVCVDDSHAVEG